MGTILFDNVVFGPVKSRRLGNSLGINLLPNDSKLCNYNCVYCECGWTFHSHQSRKKFHSVLTVLTALEEKLKLMKERKEIPDSLTFAGNGEPTLHPNFSEIISGVIKIRDKYFPESKVAVLSNGTMIHNDKVFEALSRADRNMLKLDSGIEETFRLINSPPKDFSLEKLMANLQKFKGNFIIQTLFLTGKREGKAIDNTTDEEVSAWINALAKLNPKEVHIYSLARETPSSDIFPVSDEKLQEIGNRLKGMKFQSFVFS
jgi:wyosine [tRNA(Phe)-imidazoG37] synthetase (radical SAM superfamily)